MATWRPLTVNDIEGLMRVADVVHNELPEKDSVFAERARLFPEGCFVLAEDSKIYGYAISHPIRYRQPPALNSLLHEIALDADQFYIHDVCLLPDLQGLGYAREALNRLLAVGERYTTTCLISVYGTSPFWARFGFRSPDGLDHSLLKKVSGYGDDARYLERQNAK
ncbi:hypothetical protein NPX13_g5475 [Xylaria arbuscula]|uniref:N-acetyltransferase domain-containing protein n=1 Tax=Xylaria arbuscula TaxID=114810 RepID=A0A9W8NEE7_9PEZI|nr:hypothetical protein NPX13_g5475 [Xylaria arbuscula]